MLTGETETRYLKLIGYSLKPENALTELSLVIGGYRKRGNMTLDEKKEQVKDFRPIDDVFFEVMANDPEVCEEILRVILEDSALIVESVIVQNSEKNIYGRSVRLDALCITGEGKRINIEVQRSDNDNHLKRVRFNSASITVKDSNVGDKFNDIVDVCVVYISQFDVFKEHKTIYHVDKTIRETGTIIDDGATEIFVNTAVDDGTDISELMQCFLQKSVNNPKFPKMSKRIQDLKSTEGGVSAVCEIMEKYQAEAVANAEAKTKAETEITAVFNMLIMGLSEEKVQEAYPEQFAAGKERFLQSKN